MREHKLIFSVKCIHFIFLDLSFIYTIRISPITCWLASRARRALGARQHVIGLYSHENCSNGLTITTGSCCPACRTTLIATRFWVVVICPIIKCLTVLEFSFILFDLCLFITIFNFILNYVPIVTFWIFTYHKILIFVNYLLFYMKLLNYLFFNMFGSVLGCCELTGVSLAVALANKVKIGLAF